MNRFSKILLCIGYFFLCFSEAHGKKYKVVLANLTDDFFGEVQAIQRIKKAAENLGWDCWVVNEYSKHPEVIRQLKPDFVISLHQEVKPHVNTAPHFLYIHHSLSTYLDKNGQLNTKRFPNILLYNGFIAVTPNIDPIKAAYVKTYKKPFYSVESVFSVPKRSFNASPKNRLCYWGSTWDKARGETYKPLYNLLDQTGYLDIYGPSWSWEKMHLKSYRGLLPVDDHTVVDKISECGLALVLHSPQHFKGGVPTSRIFEAASASAIIICDRHPFVVKNFGDSVFYIDPNQSADLVFKEIDSHVRWAQNNPAQAIIKANKAYAIFIQRFTLERELLKIATLFEKMKKEQ